jgi:hypothetical protein
MATVYTGAISGQVWTTDKARITTGTNAVTFNVGLSAKPTSNASVTLYSSAINVPANSTTDLWVGVGNQVTIVGSNGTATEIGAATSGNSGVFD